MCCTGSRFGSTPLIFLHLHNINLFQNGFNWFIDFIIWLNPTYSGEAEITKEQSQFLNQNFNFLIVFMYLQIVVEVFSISFPIMYWAFLNLF